MNNMKKTARTVNSAKNIAGNFISNFICYVLRFISRTVFIKTIGEFYLGINGLLSNVLTILSLAELGISTAINFSLYKPLSEGNESKIVALMNFYKKAFHWVALVVLILGLLIFPFLDLIIKDNPGYEHLNLIYLIFVLNMVISYLMSYKRVLATADQKSYKVVYYTTISTFVATLAQIFILIFTKNYIAYLLIQTLFIIFENFLVNRFVDREYPFLKTIKPEKLEESELKNIKINVKALVFHRIGETCINSTDNIIISAFVGVNFVGLYSNYLMLMTMIQGFILVIFNNLIASFGNLIAEDNHEKNYEIFKTIDFLSYIIYFIASICFINLYNPFITLWIGKEWLLPFEVVAIVVLNFYIAGMRVSLATVKSAAGIYDADKFDPILQSIINIATSIIFAIKFGIFGVFLGTFICSLVPFIHRPIVVYRKLFDKPVKSYFVNYFKELFIVLITFLITLLLINCFNFTSGILNLIIRLIISVTIPSICIFVIYNKTYEMQKLKETIKKLLGGFRRV